MHFTTSVRNIYNCSLERAFKTPILCDVTKVHTGLWIMPKVVGVSDDENWGQVGSSKKIYVAASMSQKGGFASVDNILGRTENEEWTIQVDDFQSWMLGFYKFVAVWKTTELEPNKIQIDYTYKLYSNNILLYPLNWLFTKLFWHRYMKQVVENVRKLAYDEEPYMYK